MGLRCTHFSSSLRARDGTCRARPTWRRSRGSRWKQRIARIVRRPHATVRFPIKGGYLYLNTTNPLLRTASRGTIGAEDRLDRRGGPLLRGRRAPRAGDDRRGADALAEHAAQSKKLLTAAFKLRPRAGAALRMAPRAGQRDPRRRQYSDYRLPLPRAVVAHRRRRAAGPVAAGRRTG